MKTNSKKILVGFLSLIMTLGLVLPSVSFAQKTPSKKLFCSNIDQIIAPIEKRMTDGEEKLATKWQERGANLTKREADRMTRLSSNRDIHADNRNTQYAKLEAKATTDTQKQAVASFKATVESAVSIRKDAFDSAISSVEQSVEQSIDARRVAVITATDQLKSAKTTAIERAKDDCSSGVDDKTVRETFRTSLKLAQDTFKSDIRAIERIKGSFDSVRTTKKQAIEKAIADFNIIMEKARIDLKAAFQ